MNDEILVPLDLADAIAMIDRQKEQITALTAYKENNYDPNESIRLTAEIMKQKEEIAALTTLLRKETEEIRLLRRALGNYNPYHNLLMPEEALRGGEEG